MDVDLHAPTSRGDADVEMAHDLVSTQNLQLCLDRETATSQAVEYQYLGMGVVKSAAEFEQAGPEIGGAAAGGVA